uniref:Uncharacterized protein n=1 Tax=Rhizophora mucronata TaxID=61149 RepID=A0A2P2N6D4_RHIMU
MKDKICLQMSIYLHAHFLCLFEGSICELAICMCVCLHELIWSTSCHLH